MKNSILFATIFGLLIAFAAAPALACSQSNVGRYAKTTPPIAQKAKFDIKDTGKTK